MTGGTPQKPKLLVDLDLVNFSYVIITTILGVFLPLVMLESLSEYIKFMFNVDLGNIIFIAGIAILLSMIFFNYYLIESINSGKLMREFTGETKRRWVSHIVSTLSPIALFLEIFALIDLYVLNGAIYLLALSAGAYVFLMKKLDVRDTEQEGQ